MIVYFSKQINDIEKEMASIIKEEDKLNEIV